MNLMKMSMISIDCIFDNVNLSGMISGHVRRSPDDSRLEKYQLLKTSIIIITIIIMTIIIMTIIIVTSWEADPFIMDERYLAVMVKNKVDDIWDTVMIFVIMMVILFVEKLSDDNDGVDVDDDDDVGDEDDVEDDARTICSGGCGVAALGGRQLGEAFLPPAAASDQSQTCESKRKVGTPPT